MKYSLPIFLVVALAFCVVMLFRTSQKDPEPSTEKYDSLRNRLEQSETQRTNYLDSIHNLNTRFLLLDSLTKEKDKELTRIRGRYKIYTHKELELEMERRFDASK